MPWSKHCSRRSNPELIWRTSFQSRRQAEHAISRYIDGFYNPIRRHSALGYKSPIKFEDEATKRQWLSTNRGQIQEALHNGWDKNDPRDAQVILHMLQVGATQRYHDRLGAGINDVQELSKTYEAIAKAKTEIQHHILTHYLPSRD